MSLRNENMEKLVVIALLSYMILQIFGETLRENCYSEKSRKRYSGIHLILFPMVINNQIPWGMIKSQALEFFQKEFLLRLQSG